MTAPAPLLTIGDLILAATLAHISGNEDLAAKLRAAAEGAAEDAAGDDPEGRQAIIVSRAQLRRTLRDEGLTTTGTGRGDQVFDRLAGIDRLGWMAEPAATQPDDRDPYPTFPYPSSNHLGSPRGAR
jgi:hypothetical protein